jgi:hypothetical protein
MPPKGKGKGKGSNEPSSSKPKTKGKSSPFTDEECLHCHKKGHWFRRRRRRRRRRRSETSTLVINGIEIIFAISSSDSYVFDIRSMIHTCKLLQGLSLTRRFVKGKLDDRVANGAKVATIAVDTYHLPLPS